MYLLDVAHQTDQINLNASRGESEALLLCTAIAPLKTVSYYCHNLKT